MAKTFIGIVSSAKPDKTIVVSVASSKTHPLYRKQYVTSKKFMAHDEKNEAQEGDKVAIVETRPLSARKRYRLDRVIETAAIRHTEPEPEVSKPVEKPVEKKADAEEKA